MIVVSDEYKSAAEESIRDIDTKIVIGSVEYDDSNNMVIEVSRSISDNGFTIGSCISDMMTVEIAHLHANQISSLSNYNIIPYVYIGDAENRLGNFFITDAKAEGKILKLEAHDKMYFLDKPCKFNGNSSGTVSALTFPATHAQILDYIAAMCNFTHKCICYEFAPVVQRPLYNSEGVFDSEKYYTYREIIGFIASANASNAHFDNNGELEFIYPGNPVETILEEKCESLSACEADEGFKVKGVRFISKAISYFINDTEGAEYSDDMDGIIECDNPLATVEIAEYVWSKLGNFTYYSAAISRRGKGILYPGDVVEFLHNGFNYNSYITEISYRISADDGFKENIISSADSPAQSENRSISSEHTEENAKNITNNVNVDKAIILRDKASQMVIHNYTEIGYLSGNTIGYGDVSNKIVVCGYNFLYIPTLYIGTAVDTYYSVMEFPTVRSESKTVNWSNYKVEARLTDVSGNGYKTYKKVVSYIDENGTERTYYYDSLSTDGFCALVPVWDRILSAADGFEYGCVHAEEINLVAIKDGIVVDSDNFPYYDRLYISFSSEAEYNAAVGLTNTPIELIELKDFQYLVPESQIIVDKELSPDSDNVIANSTVAKALSLKADKEAIEELTLVVESKADVIELEALSEDYNTAKADFDTRIRKLATASANHGIILNEHADMLELKADKTEVQLIAQELEGKAELSDLNFIGENMLENATFHSNFSGWTFTNNNFSEITVKDNFPCAHFSGGIGKSTSVRQSVLDEIDKENLDQLYTFSADIRLDDYVAGTTNPFAQLYFSATYDNNGTSSAFNATTVAGSPDLTQYNGQGWQKVYWTVRFTRVPNSIYAFVYARDFTGELYFKNLKLEKGSVPTAYTPSVTDYTELVDRVATLEAALLSLGGEI